MTSDYQITARLGYVIAQLKSRGVPFEYARPQGDPVVSSYGGRTFTVLNFTRAHIETAKAPNNETTVKLKDFENAPVPVSFSAQSEALIVTSIQKMLSTVEINLFETDYGDPEVLWSKWNNVVYRKNCETVNDKCLTIPPDIGLEVGFLSQQDFERVVANSRLYQADEGPCLFMVDLAVLDDEIKQRLAAMLETNTGAVCTSTILSTPQTSLVLYSMDQKRYILVPVKGNSGVALDERTVTFSHNAEALDSATYQLATCSAGATAYENDQVIMRFKRQTANGIKEHLKQLERMHVRWVVEEHPQITKLVQIQSDERVSTLGSDRYLASNCTSQLFLDTLGNNSAQIGTGEADFSSPDVTLKITTKSKNSLLKSFSALIRPIGRVAPDRLQVMHTSGSVDLDLYPTTATSPYRVGFLDILQKRPGVVLSTQTAPIKQKYMVKLGITADVAHIILEYQAEEATSAFQYITPGMMV